MKDIDILVIGDLNADLILRGNAIPKFGQAETLVDEADLTLGSSGAIFACGAARLGLRVAYSGVAGDDVFGKFVLNALQNRNVDTSGVQIDAELQTGLSVILVQENDRAILTHPGAINAQRAEGVNRALLRRARHLHIASYFLQQNLQAGLPNLLIEAHQLGCTISLDTNWDPAETWNSGLSSVLPLIDIFLPNEQEALAISGQKTLDEALAFLAWEIPVVVVKQGAMGAVVRREDTVIRQSPPPVAVADAIGAGDSFDAGFIYGYLNNFSLAESLRWGLACGALSTRVAGGTTAQPTLAEVSSLIRDAAP